MVKTPYDMINFNNLVNSLLSLCSLVSYRVKHSKKNSTSTRAHTICHYKVKYLSGVFSPQYVVNASVDVFQRGLVCKMAAFVQLAVFNVVLDLIVYRQTSTVIDTPQIALLWVWSDRIVEDMVDKLLVMTGVSLLNERDLFTFSSKAVAPFLKNWNEYTKRLRNHHFIIFTPHLRNDVSHNVQWADYLVKISPISMCQSTFNKNQSNEFKENNFTIWIFKAQVIKSMCLIFANYGAQIIWYGSST